MAGKKDKKGRDTNKNRTKRAVALQSLGQCLVPESDGLGTQPYHFATEAL
jgi:hypothetical protein